MSGNSYSASVNELRERISKMVRPIFPSSLQCVENEFLTQLHIPKKSCSMLKVGGAAAADSQAAWLALKIPL